MTETNENAVREGRIIRGVGGIYSVDLDGGATVSCRVRGALRATFSSAARTAGAYHTGSRLDRPLTGDRVRVELAANAAGGAGDGCCVSCALSVCGRRFACVQHPLRVLRGRRRCCPAASGGNSPAGRSAKILISFHICIGSLSDDEKYCSGLGAVCGAGVYYRERSGRPLVSVRKFLFPIRCFSEYFYFLCINH